MGVRWQVTAKVRAKADQARAAAAAYLRSSSPPGSAAAVVAATKVAATVTATSAGGVTVDLDGVSSRVEGAVTVLGGGGHRDTAAAQPEEEADWVAGAGQRGP